MTAAAWRPPESGIAQKDLPLWNMAMSHMGAPMPLDQSGVSLRLSPIAAPHLKGPLHALNAASGETLFLHLDAFPYAELLGVDFDLDAVAGLPSNLADAIYTGSAELLLNAFPDTLTAGISYETIMADAATQPDELKWFAAALDGLANTPVFFSVGATAADICALLNEKLHQPRPVLTGLRQTLDVAAYRLIGHAFLPLDAVRDLGIGDFIVLAPTEAGDVAIMCEDRAFYFETTEDGWLCNAIQSLAHVRKMTAMDDAPIDPQDPADVIPKDPQDMTAPLPEMAALVSTVLTFECGEARVTLAELESFQSGAIVPLPDQLTQDGVQVTIRAGEQAIATGEIVHVDDRIAVRINRLLAQTS